MTFGDQCKGYHHHIPYSVYAYNRYIYIYIYIYRERDHVYVLITRVIIITLIALITLRTSERGTADPHVMRSPAKLFRPRI